VKFRTSVLDGKTVIIELETGDEGRLVELMTEFGDGYAIFGEGVPVPIAVVDGRLLEEEWCTSEHLLAIEAHELGHIRTDSIDEPVAELEAIRLLESTGHSAAADLLRARGIVDLDSAFDPRASVVAQNCGM